LLESDYSYGVLGGKCDLVIFARSRGGDMNVKAHHTLDELLTLIQDGNESQIGLGRRLSAII